MILINFRKERSRYVIFHVITEQQTIISKEDILKSLWNVIKFYFGLKYVIKMGLWIIEYDSQKRYGIIRFSHTMKENLIAALSLIRQINGKRIILSPYKTAGTLKKIRKYRNQKLK